MLFDDTASISILPFPRRAPTVNALINRKMMDGHYCAPETISVPFDSPRIPPASFDAHLTKFKFLCRRSCSNQVEICEFAIQLEGYPLWDNYAATMGKKYSREASFSRKSSLETRPSFSSVKSTEVETVE